MLGPDDWNPTGEGDLHEKDDRIGARVTGSTRLRRRQLLPVRPEGALPRRSTDDDRKEQIVFENTKAFSGFSVDDVPEAKKFYSGLR
jgi:hypothetical protein